MPNVSRVFTTVWTLTWINLWSSLLSGLLADIFLYADPGWHVYWCVANLFDDICFLKSLCTNYCYVFSKYNICLSKSNRLWLHLVVIYSIGKLLFWHLIDMVDFYWFWCVSDDDFEFIHASFHDLKPLNWIFGCFQAKIPLFQPVLDFADLQRASLKVRALRVNYLQTLGYFHDSHDSDWKSQTGSSFLIMAVQSEVYFWNGSHHHYYIKKKTDAISQLNCQSSSNIGDTSFSKEHIYDIVKCTVTKSQSGICCPRLWKHDANFFH